MKLYLFGKVFLHFNDWIHKTKQKLKIVADSSDLVIIIILIILLHLIFATIVYFQLFFVN